MLTIGGSIDKFLESVKMARSENTYRTYRNGMMVFKDCLLSHKINSTEETIEQLPDEAIIWIADSLKASAPTTERLYLTVVTIFYEFLAAENLTPVNLARIRLLIRQRARRPGQRLPQFPRDDIDIVLVYAQKLKSAASTNEAEHLRNLRDRAFLVTLAETGLRVHEACGLRRGDIDWNEGRAIIIGKGNRQAVVRFSRLSLAALKDYLAARVAQDGGSGKALTSLPLFARHDKGSGKKVKPITTTTGRNIVELRVSEALGEAASRITPHSFRHYFVTRVLQTSGNLKLAQELARHKNIAVTQRYAHLSDNELDKGYWDVFEEK